MKRKPLPSYVQASFWALEMLGLNTYLSPKLSTCSCSFLACNHEFLPESLYIQYSLTLAVITISYILLFALTFFIELSQIKVWYFCFLIFTRGHLYTFLLFFLQFYSFTTFLKSLFDQFGILRAHLFLITFAMFYFASILLISTFLSVRHHITGKIYFREAIPLVK